MEENFEDIFEKLNGELGLETLQLIDDLSDEDADNLVGFAPAMMRCLDEVLKRGEDISHAMVALAELVEDNPELFLEGLHETLPLMFKIAMADDLGQVIKQSTLSFLLDLIHYCPFMFGMEEGYVKAGGNYRRRLLHELAHLLTEVSEEQWQKRYAALDLLAQIPLYHYEVE
ncbi:Armadillo-like helical [Corchorus capsularis]|uniref:Armadillo-like helical n=1 Tax=Corchorus capsularis TaxID=210143 RepID=A0A1R3HCB1_COCAP|nr:Armadillo-like helical [Corchorus capsularis]